MEPTPSLYLWFLAFGGQLALAYIAYRLTRGRRKADREQ